MLVAIRMMDLEFLKQTSVPAVFESYFLSSRVLHSMPRARFVHPHEKVLFMDRTMKDSFKTAINRKYQR